ncbi:MAG: class II fructose-bisphosphate aldolase family protein [Candidatus Niyogibacteria bacterium]|nr:class II fructose-bisphosphate aldolase family protein [Candidatus Niyogibacteria bacterium]
MKTLKEYLKDAAASKAAIGHFNISNLVQLKGIVSACLKTNSPVMIGTSEGEADFLGMKTARHLVDAAKEETGLPIFLNADHFHGFERVKEAIDAGYDSILIDCSKKPYEENLEITKRAVEYAKSVNLEISVEGELGYLVTDSSKIYKEKIEIPPESLTKPEEALKYVNETGIDRLAPAVGNLHGIAANEPKLDFELIKKLRAVLPEEVALVLHGGSGIPDDQMREAVKLGFNNVHVSTELRAAYTDALRKMLAAAPEETTPYKIYAPVVEAVSVKVSEKLELFKGIN